MQLRDFLNLSVFDAYLLTMNSSPGHGRIPMAFFSDPDKTQKVNLSPHLVLKLRILNNHNRRFIVAIQVSLLMYCE